MKKIAPPLDESDTALAHEESECRENEKAVLLALSHETAAARNKNDLLGLVNDKIRQMFSFQYYTLCLISEDQQYHSLFLCSQEPALMEHPDMLRLADVNFEINDGICNVVLASEEPCIFSLDELLQRDGAPAWVSVWHSLHIRQLMAMALPGGPGKKGFFCFYADRPDAFSKSQFRLLQGVCAQISTAVSNVLANERIEKQLAEIKHYKQQLEEEHLYLQEENNMACNFSEIVGSGPEMQKVIHLVSQVAGCDTTVLIQGETGTGKELIARAIHSASTRWNKLMIKVNCAALPPDLIESELFGHEKGSFAGARKRKVGKFELAHNSTLFLDEVSELPAEIQAKLLKVLQEKEIDRIGGKKSIQVNVRLVTATNRHLQQEVNAGRFRSDLYYHLSAFPIPLAPLRHRREDIPELAAHFIMRYARKTGKKITGISHKVLQELTAYPWPGNIRELEHLVERSVLLAGSHTLKKVDIPAAYPKMAADTAEEDFTIKPLDVFERDYIVEVIKRCKGRISGPQGAALKLGLPSTTLISKMQKLGIRKEHFHEKAEDREAR